MNHILPVPSLNFVVFVPSSLRSSYLPGPGTDVQVCCPFFSIYTGCWWGSLKFSVPWSTRIWIKTKRNESEQFFSECLEGLGVGGWEEMCKGYISFLCWGNTICTKGFYQSGIWAGGAWDRCLPLPVYTWQLELLVVLQWQQGGPAEAQQTHSCTTTPYKLSYCSGLAHSLNSGQDSPGG